MVPGVTPSSTDVTGTIHSFGTTSSPNDPVEPINVEDNDGADDGATVLRIVRGPSAGTSIKLVGDSMSAGRAPDMAIFLDDITVSRSHARFDRTPSGWRFVDLGSLNGSYVNRTRVDAVDLASGDEIQIGKYRFHILMWDATTAEAAADGESASG